MQMLQSIFAGSDALLVGGPSAGWVGFLIVGCLGEADLDCVGVVFGVDGRGEPVVCSGGFVGGLRDCLYDKVD